VSVVKGVHCIVDGRKFIVRFCRSGNPQGIKERVVYAKGRPWEALYDKPYWHHSQKLGGPATLPQRIIAAARINAHIPNEETQAAIRESRALAREQKT